MWGGFLCREPVLYGSRAGWGCGVGEPGLVGRARGRAEPQPGSGSLGSPRFGVGRRFFVFSTPIPICSVRFSTCKSGSTPLTWSMTYQISGQKQSLL
jgi:hypothetical protein